MLVGHCRGLVDSLSRRLVPDELWEIVQLDLPHFREGMHYEE